MNIPSAVNNIASAKLRFSSRETLLYALALILALSVRLYNLGAAPLSDYEASAAMQALQAARPEGAAPAFGPQMAYISLTGSLFFLSGSSSNFLARLWPALAGVLLAGIPFLLRRRLGRGVALILAFGLALDPGLTAVSRLAGSPMLALSFTLLALALWDNRQYLLAGITGGLALLSGPAALGGIIVLALTGLILRLARQPLWTKQDVSDTEPLPVLSRRSAWRDAGIGAAASLLLTGTLFLRYPQGIAAWASTLSAYLSGWANVSSVPAGALPVALLVYQPAAMLLTLIGIVVWLVRQVVPPVEEGSFSNDETFDEDADAVEPSIPENIQRKVYPAPPLSALLWAVLALLLGLISPGRQVLDLVWVLIPIWLLAAWSLHTHLQGLSTNPVSLVHAGLLLVLTNLFWMTLIATRLIDPLPQVSWPVVRAGVLLVVLVLGGLISGLIAIGWSWRIARDGLAWGLGAALLVYTIAALWGATQLRPNMPQELWWPSPGVVQANLFTQTLTDLSKWQTGLPDDLDIVSLVDTPALRWALRDFSNARFLNAPLPGKQPSVLITAQEGSAPELAMSYRGQDFLWSAWPGWSSSLPPDFVSWLAFRKAPLQTAHIILWMRADLKPAGSLIELPESSPADAPVTIPRDSLPPDEEQGPIK